MPKIQEYLPEQNASGPVGALSPNLEQVTLFGRGIEKFGTELTGALQAVEQRNTQVEVSDANATISQARADYMDRIAQETNDGTLDVDKVKGDYQKFVEKEYDNFSTAGGRNTFNRLSARAGGSILQHAAHGYSVVQSNQAKADLVTSVNNYSSVLMKDPTQFPDIRDSQTEAIQAQVDAGMLTPPQQIQMQKAVDVELSKAATRGYAQSDYENMKQAIVATGGKVDPEDPRYNTARHMLDAGGFDQFLDSSQKHSLYQELRQNQTAAQTEGLRLLNIHDGALNGQQEVWKQQAVAKLAKNTLSTDDVLKSPMDAADKYTWIERIKSWSKQEIATDPRVKNNLTQRILSADNEPGHISDMSQLTQAVGHGISPQDYEHLSNLIDKSPQGQVNKHNEKSLIDMAKAKLVKPSGLGGFPDPDGEYNLMMFTNALQEAKQKAIAEGKPASAVLNPNSPEFFGKEIQHYQLTPQQIMTKMASQYRGQANAPTTVQTMPGVPTPAGNYTTPAPKFTPDDIGLMSKSELSKLPANRLTPEQREAARLRYNALSKGK